MKRPLIVALADVACFAAGLWVSLPEQTRRELHAAALHQLAGHARAGAHILGLVAIAAEARYWKVVQP